MLLILMLYTSWCPLCIQFADELEQSEPTMTLQPEEKQEKRDPTPHPNANQMTQSVAVPQWQTVTGFNGASYALDPALMIAMTPSLTNIFCT